MYDWFEFSPDSTMNCVGDLFVYYYDKSNKNDLQGVVQIFNLFIWSIGVETLGKALELHKKNKFPFASEEEIIQNDISQLKAPIYLGFAGLAFDKYYADRAKRFLMPFNVRNELPLVLISQKSQICASAIFDVVWQVFGYEHQGENAI